MALWVISSCDFDKNEKKTEKLIKMALKSAKNHLKLSNFDSMLQAHFETNPRNSFGFI